MPRTIRHRSLALALVTLLALAPLALAHGAPTAKQKDVEHLRVTYFTFEELFEREWARLGFAAEDRDMGTTIDLAGTEVLFEFLGADGTVAHEERVALKAGDDRWNADVFIENAHVLRATLEADDVTVTFDQEITQGPEGGTPDGSAPTGGGDAAPGDAPSATPAPGVLAVLALAGAVALTARGARHARP